MMKKVTIDEMIERYVACGNSLDSIDECDLNAIDSVLNSYFSIALNNSNAAVMPRKISINPYACYSSFMPLYMYSLLGQILYERIKHLMFDLRYKIISHVTHIQKFGVHTNDWCYDLYICKIAEVTDEYAYAVLWRKFKDEGKLTTKHNYFTMKLIEKNSEYGKIDIDFCDIIKKE